ncbi:hypothetical protein [Tenuibacillus multivorans]|uniref:Uncharacterized protein n=1 Tax=Tenuibacillus multivorans TaxID=237069 RepID=A0A1H0AV31_9BACI|nr:hypothetical protein [Tenuibacillus multivorans]GEL77819.1 hypothetical protein TMU01_20540 [Tenuibacillus multivorans]SDN36913.1 hypothetical protein SAMN05216498_2075 [Tenuibacillus multivorans]
MSTKKVCTLLLMMAMLVACQNDNLNLSEEVTQIEVYQWDSGELVSTIQDKEFIEKLVNQLDSARTGSTADMDFAAPDYRLLFKHNEATLFQFGYFKETVRLNVKGRYWDSNASEMYEVDIKLAIE